MSLGKPETDLPIEGINRIKCISNSYDIITPCEEKALVIIIPD
jgi:hypothetical protein